MPDSARDPLLHHGCRWRFSERGTAEGTGPSIWSVPSGKGRAGLQERVDRIALAASMMTDTKMEKKFIDGCSNTVPNKVLESLMWDNFNDLGVCHYTEEELKLRESPLRFRWG